MDRQLLGESAGGDSVTDLTLPDVDLPDVALPYSSLAEASLHGSVGKKWASPGFKEEPMVVVFRLESGSCLVRFLYSNWVIWGIDYYTRPKGVGLAWVYLIYGFGIGFILLIILWDITHAVFLQLLACKEPLCYGVEAE